MPKRREIQNKRQMSARLYFSFVAIGIFLYCINRSCEGPRNGCQPDSFESGGIHLKVNEPQSTKAQGNNLQGLIGSTIGFLPQEAYEIYEKNKGADYPACYQAMPL